MKRDYKQSQTQSVLVFTYVRFGFGLHPGKSLHFILYLAHIALHKCTFYTYADRRKCVHIEIFDRSQYSDGSPYISLSV